MDVVIKDVFDGDSVLKESHVSQKLSFKLFGSFEHRFCIKMKKKVGKTSQRRFFQVFLEVYFAFSNSLLP